MRPWPFSLEAFITQVVVALFSFDLHRSNQVGSSEDMAICLFLASM